MSRLINGLERMGEAMSPQPKEQAVEQDETAQDHLRVTCWEIAREIAIEAQGLPSDDDTLLASDRITELTSCMVGIEDPEVIEQILLMLPERVRLPLQPAFADDINKSKEE